MIVNRVKMERSEHIRLARLMNVHFFSVPLSSESEGKVHGQVELGTVQIIIHMWLSHVAIWLMRECKCKPLTFAYHEQEAVRTGRVKWQVSFNPGKPQVKGLEGLAPGLRYPVSWNFHLIHKTRDAKKIPKDLGVK